MTDEEQPTADAALEPVTVEVTAAQGLTYAGRHYEQGEEVTVARHFADDIVAAQAGRIVG